MKDAVVLCPRDRSGENALHDHSAEERSSCGRFAQSHEASGSFESQRDRVHDSGLKKPRWLLTEKTGGPDVVLNDDVERWPDAWLVEAIRDDPPDLAALNVLANRHGKELWQRCLRLTADIHKANDLAQETWYRLLRGRRRLRSDKNVRAYLKTVATNLWRDQYRAARRAGAMAELRLIPLEAARHGDMSCPVRAPAWDVDRQQGPLIEAVPDVRAMESHARILLFEDIQHALGALSPLQREVLQARFLEGESCAMIGARLHRTEQTISAWIRDALHLVRRHLGAERR